MGQLAAIATVPRAGRPTPAEPKAHLSLPPASGRDASERRAEADRLLSDPAWLRRQYEQHGDDTIARDLSLALDLHVSRKTVRLARDRLGIQSLPPGRRGRPLQAVPPAGHERQNGEMVLTGTALAMLTRFQKEQSKRAPATDEVLAKRIRAYSQAQTEGDQLAAEDALLAIASAAGLIHQHRRRLRGVA